MANKRRARQIRNEIHNLDLTNPEHVEIYEARQLEFMIDNEGKFNKVYDDRPGQPSNCETIGRRQCEFLPKYAKLCNYL